MSHRLLDSEIILTTLLQIQWLYSAES